jgi:hypothetical protein
MPRILVAMALLCAAADAFVAPAPAALPARILRAPRRALVRRLCPRCSAVCLPVSRKHRKTRNTLRARRLPARGGLRAVTPARLR